MTHVHVFTGRFPLSVEEVEAEERRVAEHFQERGRQLSEDRNQRIWKAFENWKAGQQLNAQAVLTVIAGAGFESICILNTGS